MNEKTCPDAGTKITKKGFLVSKNEMSCASFRSDAPSFLGEEMPSHSSKRLVKADGNI